MSERLVIFQKNTDSHGAYDATKKEYTIVEDGFYTIKKYCYAGEVISSPSAVINKDIPITFEDIKRNNK